MRESCGEHPNLQKNSSCQNIPKLLTKTPCHLGMQAWLTRHSSARLGAEEVGQVGIVAFIPKSGTATVDLG